MEWAIEVKMVRFFGDNGKPADTIITHLLSPYASDNSAVSDSEKLAQSSLNGRKAILIYGFDHDNRPLEPAIEAFETLAQLKVRLSVRLSCAFQDLIHPVHTKGKVFAWGIFLCLVGDPGKPHAHARKRRAESSWTMTTQP